VSGTVATLNFASASLGEGEPTEIEIHDGRAADLPGWEACGFELVRHHTPFDAWHDDDAVAAEHHAEMERLARSLTGCDHALVTSHIVRGPDQARRHEDLAPITFVHSDFAPGYDALLRRMYRTGDAAGAQAALARNGIDADDVDRASRIVILQFWRNIGPPKMDYPIAFCDARSIDHDDGKAFLVTDYAGSGIDFEAIAVMAPSPRSPQRWYTFPEPTVDEVVAFRTYDSELVARRQVYFTPHSAFRDPDVEIGRPARRSIELRATCLYLSP
jgi:hypothetical protein